MDYNLIPIFQNYISITRNNKSFNDLINTKITRNLGNRNMYFINLNYFMDFINLPIFFLFIKLNKYLTIYD